MEEVDKAMRNRKLRARRKFVRWTRNEADVRGTPMNRQLEGGQGEEEGEEKDKKVRDRDK